MGYKEKRIIIDNFMHLVEVAKLEFLVDGIPAVNFCPSRGNKRRQLRTPLVSRQFDGATCL